MIVFLPPNFEKPTESTQLSASPNVYIERVHKQQGLVIYDIQFDVILDEWSRMESLYAQLHLTPLSRAPSSSERFHVFAVVWSCCPQLDPRQPFATLELFDFAVTQRKVLRLWRRLAGWAKTLQAGDCVQVREVVASSAGDLLQSTAETQIFLLSSPQPGKQLSTRAGHLNAAEQEILIFLQKKALICPVETPKTRLSAFKPVALCKDSSSGYWQLFGSTAPSVTCQSLARIRFKALDASTWIKLQDLVDSWFRAELSFDGLSLDLEFLSTSAMSMKGVTEPFIPESEALRAAALAPNSIFNGLIRLSGRLQLLQLFAATDANNTLNASLSTSQPDRLALIFNGERLVLDNLEWRAGMVGAEAEFTLLVKTFLEDEDIVIRKSYTLCYCL